MKGRNLWNLMIQAIKFGIVGISNTLISMAVYYLCLALGIHYIAANVLGFIVGTINAYFWNNKYVFKKQENEVRDTKKSVIKVFISYGFTLGLSTMLLAFWVDGLHISDKIAPVLNLLVTIPVNFVLNKFWAFRGERKS
jgi:putative flippase GtrA